MSLQLAAASYIYIYIYILRFKEKIEKSGDDGKRNFTQVGKCKAVQVCWQT